VISPRKTSKKLLLVKQHCYYSYLSDVVLLYCLKTRRKRLAYRQATTIVCISINNFHKRLILFAQLSINSHKPIFSDSFHLLHCFDLMGPNINIYWVQKYDSPMNKQREIFHLSNQINFLVCNIFFGSLFV